MPLWAFFVRTLVHRHSLRRVTQSRKHGRQWQPPQQPLRSYTTALQPSLRDDSVVAPHASIVGRLDDPRQLSLPLSGERSQPAGLQLPNATRRRVIQRRVVRRRRASKPFRTAKVASVRPHATKGRTLTRAELRRRRRKQAGLLLDTSAKDISFRAKNPLPDWKHQFARIRSYYINKHDTPQFPNLDIRTLEWVELVINRLDDGQRTLTRKDLIYLSLEAFKGPIWIWQQIALWLLAYDQQNMIRFLLATHIDPYIPGGLVAASLTHLVGYFERSNESVVAFHMQQLAEAFCVLADRTGKDVLAIHSPLVGRLVPYCSDKQIHSIFAAASTRRVLLPPDTWLNLSRYFANNNHFEKALDCLLEAYKVGAELNEYPFRSTCSVVLRRSSKEPDGLRVCLRVVSTLVDIGVQLDGPIFDIIMLNAIDAGDLKTAFSVYHALADRGLQRRESTFRVLLQGCKMNIDDPGMLNEVIRDAIANINVRKSESVANQILHCLALHHAKHHPETALKTLTEAYAQLFDLRPLQKLRLAMPNVVQEHPNSDELMPPSRHAITFMMGASIQQILLHNRNPKEVFPLYERWRELVEAGEPFLADLVTTDHVSNIFLMAFIRTPKGLLHAARAVRDMQRPLSASAGVEQIKPTVQTWSIFLHGFTRHGQMKLAEQVMDYMRSKDIEPNLVTWNTLMTGYARLQDVEGTVSALRQAEAEGMVWDAWTYGGLKRLKDQRRLQEEYEKSKLLQDLDFTNDLKQGLGQRLSEPSELPVDVADKDSYQPSGESSKRGPDGQSSDSGEMEGFGDTPADIAEQGSYPLSSRGGIYARQ